MSDDEDNWQYVCVYCKNDCYVEPCYHEDCCVSVCALAPEGMTEQCLAENPHLCSNNKCLPCKEPGWSRSRYMCGMHSWWCHLCYNVFCLECKHVAEGATLEECDMCEKQGHDLCIGEVCAGCYKKTLVE